MCGTAACQSWQLLSAYQGDSLGIVNISAQEEEPAVCAAFQKFRKPSQLFRKVGPALHKGVDTVHLNGRDDDIDAGCRAVKLVMQPFPLLCSEYGVPVPVRNAWAEEARACSRQVRKRRRALNAV
jgi:hypothetical protein